MLSFVGGLGGERKELFKVIAIEDLSEDEITSEEHQSYLEEIEDEENTRIMPEVIMQCVEDDSIEEIADFTLQKQVTYGR